MLKIMKNNKGFLFDPIVLLVAFIAFCIVGLVFFILFSLAGELGVYDISSDSVSISSNHHLLTTLRTPIEVDGQKMLFADLVALGENSEELREEVRVQIGLNGQIDLISLKENYAIRVVYPNGDEIDLYGKPLFEDDVLSIVEIPSLNGGTIEVELVENEVDIKSMIDNMEAGQVLYNFAGETWVAWGIDNQITHFKIKDCYCKIEVRGGITYCEDGKERNSKYFIAKEAFNIQSAAAIIKNCNELEGKEDDSKSNLLDPIYDKINDISHENKAGEQIRDFQGETWTYWGSYHNAKSAQQIGAYNYWTSQKICKCRRPTHCPNTCETVETSYGTLMCKEDKNTIWPESVNENENKCFINTKDLLDVVGLSMEK